MNFKLALATRLFPLIAWIWPMVVQAAPVDELSPVELEEIAVEVYVYGFPMVIMDLTRGMKTGSPATAENQTRGAVNEWGHARAFPTDKFTDVVRPNADTLYSIMWMDLTAEPLVIGVPNSDGRYYLLQFLDMWTDTFASVGTRTTGNGAGRFLVAGPGWAGEPPADAEVIRAPTPGVWIIGRTQTNGPDDYPNVHKFQDGFEAAPLSQWGKERKAATTHTDASDPLANQKTPPLEQAVKMDGRTFFQKLGELGKIHPPHAIDQPVLSRMRRLGWTWGESFDCAAIEKHAPGILDRAVAEGLKRIRAHRTRMGSSAGGWQVRTNNVGAYGASYLRRATVAYFGLGANLPEDAVYPQTMTDAEGRPYDGSHAYVLHFEKDELPPARAFWSLTLYNDKHYFAANEIDRFAIGDRDKLKFNDDGSLDLYVQHLHPGEGKGPNWLPAPEGSFTMSLRVYWPKSEVLDGTWAPPPVKRTDQSQP